MTAIAAPSGQPYTPGCAPCHPAIDTVMTDVAAGPAGLVAVGWIIQDFRGATWWSTDGSGWSFSGGFPNETVLSAVAADPSGYVAVGQDGRGATAWWSTDGRAWHQTASNDAFADVPLRLTSVIPWGGGFLAGGFRGSDFFSADGGFWASPDGRSWRREPVSTALQDARVAALTTGGPGLVAVGEAGPADHPGPAVVWTSSDGRTWQRVRGGSVFEDARMRSVANVRGIGLVAVGENLAGSIGLVWTSRDGRHWTRAPYTPSFGRPGIQIRMYDVVAGPNGAVIVGTVTEGIQYGKSVVWTSSDGVSWSSVPSGPEFLDTEMNGATRWASWIVAVGDRGAPDAYQSTAWLSPMDVGR